MYLFKRFKHIRNVKFTIFMTCTNAIENRNKDITINNEPYDQI